MKRKVVSLLMLLMLCMTACASAEEEIPTSFPPLPVNLEQMTFYIPYNWIESELTSEDAEVGLLFQASRADGQQKLMVFNSGEGSYDAIYEQTALNEYTGVAKREDPQTYNGVEFVFTTNEEMHNAGAYICLNNTVYSFSMQNIVNEDGTVTEDAPLEALQDILLTLMPVTE